MGGMVNLDILDICGTCPIVSAVRTQLNWYQYRLYIIFGYRQHLPNYERTAFTIEIGRRRWG